VNAEFNWWLLIVGLVIGAGLVWLVLADARRRDVDITEAERASEARWISDALADAGRPVPDDTVLDVLRLHVEYLGLGPPEPWDEVDQTDEDDVSRWVPVRTETAAALRSEPTPDREPEENRGTRSAPGRGRDAVRSHMAHPVPGPDESGNRSA
jgi:hypothetical protein